jgi:hypothetical protein
MSVFGLRVCRAHWIQSTDADHFPLWSSFTASVVPHDVKAYGTAPILVNSEPDRSSDGLLCVELKRCLLLVPTLA